MRKQAGREPREVQNATWAQVAALRMERQHLRVRAPRERMIDVVRQMVGLQAQVTSAAELQLVARVEGLRRTDIRDALATERTLVKTWAMRGTLHWLASDDLPAFVAAYPTRDGTSAPAWVKAFGVSPDQLTRIIGEVGAVLTGEPMTRVELADAVEHVVRDPAAAARLRSGWGELLKPAAGRGRLSFGPDRGRNVTFVDPRAWLGLEVAPRDRAQPGQPLVALGRLVDRWLTAFPGAGRDAAARWWGVASKPKMSQAADAAGLDLVDLEVEGINGWVRLEDAVALDDARIMPSVRLLPMFDPWVNELPRQVDWLLPVDRHHAVHRAAGWVSAVVLIDGRIAGTWEIEAGKEGAGTVAVQPFFAWRDGARKELATEVDRIAAYLDRPLKPLVAAS
jgi:Winged helix DNA-binding domain